MFFFNFTVKAFNQRSQVDSYFEVDNAMCSESGKKASAVQNNCIFCISCWQVNLKGSLPVVFSSLWV